MKRRKKLALIFCLLLVGSLVFPSCLWADAQSEKDTLNVEFSEIGPLVQTFNLTAKEAKDGVEDAEKAIDNGIDAINAAIDSLNLLIQSALQSGNLVPTPNPLAPPTHDDLIYILLKAQLQSLYQQRDSLLGTDIDKLETQADMVVDTITSSLETIYISYNSLGRQLDLLKAQKKLAETQLSALEVQTELGMTTAIMLKKTENEIWSLDNSIQQLERTRQTLKEQFNLALSREFDDPLEIGEVPRVMRSKIVTADVEHDYNRAWEHSYEVILNEDEDAEREGDALRKFRHGFYSAYQDMRDKQEALELENARLKTSEQDYEIAKLKHDLGLISDLSLKTEENNFLSQKIKVELAKDAVFQAYNAYEWAKRGLIVSGGASASSSGSGSQAPCGF
mgnify:CR=1 FL=1